MNNFGVTFHLFQDEWKESMVEGWKELGNIE